MFQILDQPPDRTPRPIAKPNVRKTTHRARAEVLHSSSAAGARHNGHSLFSWSHWPRHSAWKVCAHGSATPSLFMPKRSRHMAQFGRLKQNPDVAVGGDVSAVVGRGVGRGVGVVSLGKVSRWVGFAFWWGSEFESGARNSTPAHRSRFGPKSVDVSHLDCEIDQFSTSFAHRGAITTSFRQVA